ncbi:unnamed protein product [Closterium sp. NIES-53]
MDAEMVSSKSTGTYIDAVPPSGANIVDGMWIFRVKRPPCSPPVFKDRYVARGYSQRHTAFLQGSLHEEIWLRRPPGFTGSFLAGFAPSIAGPSLFLRTDTSLPPFCVLVYVDDFIFATADTEALALVKSEMQKRHTCTDLGSSALRLLVLLATFHSSAYRSIALSSTFGRVLLRAWGSCLEDASWIYAGGMATQELLWLTYLLTDLGEQPRSPPLLYVDNKAMIALCQEHRLEHIALRYFLARELQQRGGLRLAYVTTRANTTDIFTKALWSGDHQRFSTVLGLVPTLPHLLTA